MTYPETGIITDESTGDLRAVIAAARHQAVIKPGPLLPAVAGGFTTAGFTIDPAARTVTCPAARSSAGRPAARTLRPASGRSRPGFSAQ